MDQTNETVQGAAAEFDLTMSPCPFCGNEEPRLDDCRLQWLVVCDACSACVLGDRAPEPDEIKSDDYWLPIRQTAITKWNRRAALKAQPAPTEAAQGEDSARLDASDLATIEEAAKVLESGAKHNFSKGRTVFGHVQADRASRLRAILNRSAPQPQEKP